MTFQTNPSIHQALSLRWHRLCEKAGLEGRQEWQRITGHYTEAHRAYHNLHHIADCLEQGNTCRAVAEDPIALEFAIWFHDIIYDPRASDNEVRSAEVAALFLKETQISRAVSVLIMATKHTSTALAGDEALLMDIDLSILGRSAEAYDAYSAAIRQEYVWVPWPEYASGRTEVLRNFLNRPAIFSTPPFVATYEATARQNLQREIQELTAGGAA